jgi:hypothetical protein
MDPWMDENLVILPLVIVVLAIRANNFSIYNILMIQTYMVSLELQYLFKNHLCLTVHWYFALFINIDNLNYYIY